MDLGLMKCTNLLILNQQRMITIQVCNVQIKFKLTHPGSFFIQPVYNVI